MHTQKQKSLIAFLKFITDIPDPEINKVLDVFHETRLRKDQFLVEAGDLPTTLAFVVSGILRLYYISDSGFEYTKSFCVEGEMVAAYTALLNNKPSNLFIQALEDSMLLKANYADYQALAANSPCWQRVDRVIAERLFMKKEKRESSLLLDDAQIRYLKFREEFPGLESRIKQRQVASYLGITPVSLSRLRARLQKSLSYDNDE